MQGSIIVLFFVVCKSINEWTHTFKYIKTRFHGKRGWTQIECFEYLRGFLEKVWGMRSVWSPNVKKPVECYYWDLHDFLIFLNLELTNIWKIFQTLCMVVQRMTLHLESFWVIILIFLLNHASCNANNIVAHILARACRSYDNPHCWVEPPNFVENLFSIYCSCWVTFLALKKNRLRYIGLIYIRHIQSSKKMAHL